MLLTVIFDYKRKQYFNLNCSTETLLFSIKQKILSETLESLKSSSAKFMNELSKLKEQQSSISKKNHSNESECQQNKDSNLVARTNDSKSNQSHAKAVEDKLIAIEEDIKTYVQKIEFNKNHQSFIDNIKNNSELVDFDLIDVFGDRQYINKKLDLPSNELLIPRKAYYLIFVDPKALSAKDEFKVIINEGYVIKLLSEEGALDKQTVTFKEVKNKKTKK